MLRPNIWRRRLMPMSVAICKKFVNSVKCPPLSLSLLISLPRPSRPLIIRRSEIRLRVRLEKRLTTRFAYRYVSVIPQVLHLTSLRKEACLAKLQLAFIRPHVARLVRESSGEFQCETSLQRKRENGRQQVVIQTTTASD